MNENLEQFIELVKQNTDLKVICMVDQEIVPSDDYGRYMASIGKSIVDEYWLKDERVYFKSVDMEEIEEQLESDIFIDLFRDWGRVLDEDEEKELQNILSREVRKIPWKKAIILNIDI